MTQEMLLLAKERLIGIHQEDEVKEPYRLYFQRVAFFLLELIKLKESFDRGEDKDWDLERWQEINELLYADILPQLYDESYANPAYAVKVLGNTFGAFASFVYTQLRTCIADVFEKNHERFLSHINYFLELYSEFICAAQDGRMEPDFEQVRAGLYDFIFFEYENECDRIVASKIDPSRDFALNIIEQSDFNDPRYLYRYGEYVSDNELRTAEFLLAYPEEKLKLMADIYTEGYRTGFEKTGKDLGIKKTVQIYYVLGFEPVIKLAIANFRAMGLEPVIKRDSMSVFERRYGNSSGYTGGIPNRQYAFDHKDDEACFLDKKMLKRRLDTLTGAYEKRKDLARLMAGPALIETFGQEPFSPKVKKEAFSLSSTQQDLMAWYYTMQGDMVNRYIPGDERSFTIVAYPVPEIGDEYPDIMEETIRLNTLDVDRYEKIQQAIIDNLDTCECVRITGKDGNETDLTVMLAQTTDPATQTKFENCVADVNIPLGEVFTSPHLKGTNGKLHVKRVFLEGLEYRNLWLEIKDGIVTDYGCDNGNSEKEGRELIESQILFHHESVPLGEFAIGTNTVAYMMGRTYEIEDRLPILIAEKTGPHLAVGDTCYSHAEDVKVYNPDGKEIIARDNEISLARKSDDEKERGRAYFNCHTDITIPYDELGSLYGVRKDGSILKILENGRFVLKEALELNRALDGEQ